LFFSSDPNAELFENLARDFVLDSEDVGDWSVVLTAPQLGSIRHVDQLRLDDENIPAHRHTPGHHRPDLRSEEHTSELQSLAYLYPFPYTTLFRSRFSSPVIRTRSFSKISLEISSWTARMSAIGRLY